MDVCIFIHFYVSFAGQELLLTDLPWLEQLFDRASNSYSLNDCNNFRSITPQSGLTCIEDRLLLEE